MKRITFSIFSSKECQERQLMLSDQIEMASFTFPYLYRDLLSLLELSKEEKNRS